MKHQAKAIWRGNLMRGKGFLDTESNALRAAFYSFGSRFEHDEGTAPEELIAAAYAGCFSMALVKELGISNLVPERIETKARVSLDFVGQHWKISEIDLKVRANVPGAHRAAFFSALNRTKSNCPLVQLLNIKTGLTTELEGELEPDEYPEIVIYTSTFCQVCGSAKALLEDKHIPFREIDLDEEPEEIANELKKRTGLMKVPQVFVGDQFIGDYGDLLRLDVEHKLDRLLLKKSNIQ